MASNPAFAAIPYRSNQLFRNQLVTCDRTGLRGKVLTLAYEVAVGKRTRTWRCEWNSEWLDINGKRHITRRFEMIPEYELKPVAESEAA